MKRLVVILLMLAYGFSASGTTLHLHYCCGKLKGIEWSPVSENECGEKHMMGSKPCCETKKINNSNDSDQEHILLVSELVKFSKDHVVYADPVPSRHLITRPFKVVRSHSPPESASPLFIQFCVFRI